MIPWLCCFVFWFSVCAAQLPALSSLPQNEWSTISHPETKSTCWSGGRYDFFVRKNEFDPSAQRLLVFFSDGAVCWNTESCSKQHQDPYTCSRLGRSERFAFDAAHLRTLTGLFDFEAEANPFRNYTLVVLPQCSADGHVGQSLDQADGGKHLGANNTQATLSWIFSQVAAAETVFVVGSGTGILGSLLYVPSFRVKYPEARIVVLSDSASLASLETRTNEMISRWGAIHDAYDPLLKTVMLESMSRNESALARVAETVHDRFGVAVAAIAFMNDQRQLQQFGGGRITHAWKDSMLKELVQLSELPRGFVFVGADRRHEVLQSETLNSVVVNGTRLSAWLAGLASANLSALDSSVWCANCNRDWMALLANGTCFLNHSSSSSSSSSSSPAPAAEDASPNATNATNATLPSVVGCGEGGVGVEVNDSRREHWCGCGAACGEDNSCCADYEAACEQACLLSPAAAAARCWAAALTTIQASLATQELAPDCLALLAALLPPSASAFAATPAPASSPWGSEWGVCGSGCLRRVAADVAPLACPPPARPQEQEQAQEQEGFGALERALRELAACPPPPLPSPAPPSPPPPRALAAGAALALALALPAALLLP